MKSLLLAAVTIIHDGEINSFAAIVVTGILSVLLARWLFRGRAVMVAWAVLWGGMMFAYEVMEDRSERERLGLPQRPLFGHAEEKSIPAPEPAATPVPKAERPIFIPLRPASGERQLVQGHILKSFRDGALVRCEADPPATSGLSPGLVTATSGAGDIQRAAEWAIRVRDRRVLEEYGPVLEWRGTALGSASKVPRLRAEGIVFLAGETKRNGQPVRIIATATGQTCEGAPAFASSFPAPTPAPAPDPAQIAQRAAEQRQRENADIARKYGAPSPARR
jgi:hypothetical protein